MIYGHKGGSDTGVIIERLHSHDQKGRNSFSLSMSFSPSSHRNVYLLLTIDPLVIQLKVIEKVLIVMDVDLHKIDGMPNASDFPKRHMY